MSSPQGIDIDKLELVQQKSLKLMGSRVPALCGDAERLSLVQPGDEVLSSLHAPKMGVARTQSWEDTVVSGESTRHSSLRWNTTKFCSDMRKSSP